MSELTEPEENYKAGYIKVFRSIKKHWLYEPKRKRTRFEAWLDLLLRASYGDRSELVGYDKIQVNRGDILTSQQALAEDWKWDRSAVRSFLNSLHADKNLTIKSTSKYTMITICNYGSYQGLSPTNQQHFQHQTNTTSTHTIKDKNIKNIKGNKLPLSEKEFGFLNLVNKITGRNFKTLDQKTRKGFAEILESGYTGEDFKKALKFALTEMTSRDKQNYLTPEFITRSQEFQKYVTMIPIKKKEESTNEAQHIDHSNRP